ncbi:hypothetical protein GCM10028832_08470 [Streptomyces sparsus]
MAITRIALPVRSCGASSADVVSDAVQDFDLPVITDQGRRLSGVGLLSGEPGDGVNGPDAGLAVGATVLDPDGLPGSGEEQALLPNPGRPASFSPLRGSQYRPE